MTGARPAPRLVATDALTVDEVTAIRRLLADAFADDGEGFDDDDWAHALGGVHAVVGSAGVVIAHGAVVERRLEVAGAPVRAGYVEAVATAPRRQGEGLGTTLMRALGDIIRERFELGALSTGAHGFYERLGWLRWHGPSFVSTPAGLVPTPDDDGSLMVLATPASPPLDRSGPIACDWRPGDVW